MSIAQSMLPEFDHEMATTRKFLACVPEGKHEYRPHPRSMTLARLAGHVAELPGWGATTITTAELDFAPVGGPTFQPTFFTTRSAMLDLFDANVASARAALQQVSDADLLVTWTLKSGGRQLLAMPRIAVLRSMVMNHIIHHRAQLGVYLRLLDIAIPGSYGPSADDKPPA